MKKLAIYIFALSLIEIFAPLMGQDEKKRYLIQTSEPHLTERLPESLQVIHHFEISDRDSNWAAVSLNEASHQILKRDARVLKIEEDPVRYLISPVKSRSQMGNSPKSFHTESSGLDLKPEESKVDLWGLDAVNASGLERSDANSIKVCIIDSGYNPRHEALYDQPVTYSIAGGFGSPTAEDQCEHGTHVAGTIVARSQTNGMRGLVSEQKVPLHIVKYFGQDCRKIFASQLMQGVQECVDAGSKVVNMSLGGPSSSSIESDFYDQIFKKGTLLIAAAGNDGDSGLGYPASYRSVVSVAALDQNENLAEFSQKNDEVEISAPGVDIWSTVNTFQKVILSDENSFSWTHLSPMTGSSVGERTGVLVNGGRCLAAEEKWASKIVLCERGGATFFDKAKAVERAGGLAALIYNNEPGDFRGTMGESIESPLLVMSLSQKDGWELLDHHLGKPLELDYIFKKGVSGYASYDGTSMATPHVTGVATLLWNQNPDWSAQQIREALCRGAKPLQDENGKPLAHTGCGLVQANASLHWLRTIDLDD
jgi:subtilisin family serine protease